MTLVSLPMTGDPVRRARPGRTCAAPRCETVLSVYNDRQRCSIHDFWVGGGGPKPGLFGKARRLPYPTCTHHGGHHERCSRVANHRNARTCLCPCQDVA